MGRKKQSDRKRRRTGTSTFGVPAHSSHDSSRFYEARLYTGLSTGSSEEYRENPVPARYLNRVFCKSSEQMNELPDNSVHLMVTSPPYNAGKEYDGNMSLDEYLGLLRRVMAETYRVLVHGGRACINVANLGRKPYIPLNSYLKTVMHEAGVLMRGEIVWDKGNTASPSTAWGTYLKAANPVLRDVHEYILVFCKGSFTRPYPSGRPSTISRDEFLEYTKGVWKFSAKRAMLVGHPAPFLVELHYRLVQLCSFAGEIVLDPFNGSGSTCLASVRAGRKYVGYDINSVYCRLARRRIRENKSI